jgi:DNA gyrase subunit A
MNLIEYVKAPDFPTGGTIYGYAGVKEALHTGRGKVIVRGKANIETGSWRKGNHHHYRNTIPSQ